MSSDVHWRFRSISPSEMHRDPVHVEFFSRDVDDLVRESIQNSLDATIPGNQTRVEISVVEGSDNSILAHNYLAELWPHLEAQRELRDELPLPDSALSFVVIEDFGTSGLLGDPKGDDESTESPNHFFRFWKNIGRSDKAGQSRGRWGLGKTVFPAVSRISTFFAATIRAGDEAQQSFVMGQAQLREHRLADSEKPCDPYGFWATYEGHGGDYIQLPVAAPAIVSKFWQDFGLRRQPHEPGLSVIIPYPHTTITKDAIIRAVTEQYYWPTLAGELEVISRDLHHEVHINAATLSDHVIGGTEEDDRLKARIQLAQWAVSRGGIRDVDIAIPLSEIPRWSTVVWPDGTQDALVTRFARNEKLAIRVSVPVQRTSATQAILSHFDVFLQRDELLAKSDDQYIRSGLTITRLAGKAGSGVRAILVVPTKEPLAELLGDCETPSHDYWELRGMGYRKAKQNYRNAHETITMLRDGIRGLVEALSSNEDQIDLDTLRDVFALTETDEDAIPQRRPPTAESPPEKSDAEDETDPTPELNLPESAGKGYRKVQLEDGFSIIGDANVTPPPQRIRVHLYYASSGHRGYSPWDFSLRSSGLIMRIDGVAESESAAVVDDNVLEFTPIRPDFIVEVRGFDRRRALHVEPRVLEMDQ